MRDYHDDLQREEQDIPTNVQEEKMAKILNHVDCIIAEEMRTNFEFLLTEAEVKEALRTAPTKKAPEANGIP